MINPAHPALTDTRPKWLQIAAALRAEIETMASEGQTRLPTESVRSERFGVSLMTLRQATQLKIEPLDAVIILTGTGYDPDGLVLDVARIAYRADMYRFVSRVKR